MVHIGETRQFFQIHWFLYESHVVNGEEVWHDVIIDNRKDLNYLVSMQHCKLSQIECFLWQIRYKIRKRLNHAQK